MDLIDFDLLDVDALSSDSTSVSESNSVGFSVAVEEDWRQLRNYVIEQIEAISGPFPRDPVKEGAIFKSFISRWGSRALPIARSAFENYGGYWHNAPIRPARFSKNNDPYFSAILAENL